MKDKVLIFVIGLLVGAIISSVGFFIYIKVNNKTTRQNMKENGFHQMIQNGENFEMNKKQKSQKNSNTETKKEDNKTRIDQPTENNQGTPPELPSENGESIPPQIPTNQNKS